jgi:hypothetical protein
MWDFQGDLSNDNVFWLVAQCKPFGSIPQVLDLLSSKRTTVYLLFASEHRHITSTVYNYVTEEYTI